MTCCHRLFDGIVRHELLIVVRLSSSNSASCVETKLAFNSQKLAISIAFFRYSIVQFHSDFYTTKYFAKICFVNSTKHFSCICKMSSDFYQTCLTDLIKGRFRLMPSRPNDVKFIKQMRRLL